MYEVEILNGIEWISYKRDLNMQEMDRTVYKLTMLHPGKKLRILIDKRVLIILDGSEYQYWFFKNWYMIGKSEFYNYAGSYQRRKEKKKLN